MSTWLAIEVPFLVIGGDLSSPIIGFNVIFELLKEKSVDLIKEQISVTNLRAHPHIEIIIGEITPRKDAKDTVVQDANVLLNRFVKDQQDIIRNYSLRRTGYVFHEDNKHISEECISIYAATILSQLSSQPPPSATIIKTTTICHYHHYPQRP